MDVGHLTSIDTGLHYPIDVEGLPTSWIVDFSGAFCLDIQSGFACGKHSENDIGITHVRPYNISRNGTLDLSERKYVPASYCEKRLSVNDVLFNNTNSPELIGKTTIITSNGHGLAFSNHMTRLLFSEHIKPRFAAYQLHFLWMARYYMHKCVKHVNQASISSREFGRTVPFILPPLNEQHLIVAKIEELFSEIDKGVESLQTAKAQLQIYRQALLKHAFEGKLTAEWRSQHPDKVVPAEQLLEQIKQAREERYQQQLDEWKVAIEKWEFGGKEGKKPSKPRILRTIEGNESDPESLNYALPLTGVILKISQCLREKPSNGKSVTDRAGGFKVLRLTCLKGENIDLSKYKEGDWDRGEARQYIVREGDFLISRGNGSLQLVGKGGLVTSNKEIAYPDTMIRLPVEDKIFRPRLFSVFWNSAIFRQQIETTARTTAGIYKINQQLIAEYLVPCFSLPEQDELISILDAELTNIDVLTVDIEHDILKSDALRQSILKKAFTGQLVPQDPDDEPASQLLDRIKAEKIERQSRAKAAKKSRQTSKKSPSVPL